MIIKKNQNFYFFNLLLSITLLNIFFILIYKLNLLSNDVASLNNEILNLNNQIVSLNNEILDLNIKLEKSLEKNIKLEYDNTLLKNLNKPSSNKFIKSSLLISLFVGLGLGLGYGSFILFKSKLLIPIIYNINDNLNSLTYFILSKFGLDGKNIFNIINEDGSEFIIEKDKVDLFVKLANDSIISLTDYIEKIGLNENIINNQEILNNEIVLNNEVMQIIASGLI